MSTSSRKVSVIVITYNQEKYITQTLQSIVDQVIDFGVEVIVADDNSTDRTREIIIRYAEKYPNIISPLLRKKNMGAWQNFADAIKRAQGEYIALCEGDDYWTDPNKLQRQVNFLNKHKDYVLCFHPVRVIYENSKKEDSVYPETKPELTVGELLKRNFIQTNSVMYRKQEYKDLPADMMPGDWYLHLFHARFGKIGYIDSIMSVYRRHDAGMWSANEGKPKKFWELHGYHHIMLFIYILELYGNNNEYKSIIYSKIANTIKVIFESTKKSEFIFERLVAAMPGSGATVINSQAAELREMQHEIEIRDETIRNLQNVIEKRNMEVSDIKSSKIWKFRNFIAGFIGKKKV